MVAIQLQGSEMEGDAGTLLYLNNQHTDFFFSNVIRTEVAAMIHGLIAIV